MYLINQPFIQEYYLWFGSGDLVFRNQIIGSRENFGVLPISRFLIVELSYLIIVVFLAYLFTKVEEVIARQILSRSKPRDREVKDLRMIPPL